MSSAVVRQKNTLSYDKTNQLYIRKYLGNYYSPLEL